VEKRERFMTTRSLKIYTAEWQKATPGIKQYIAPDENKNGRCFPDVENEAFDPGRQNRNLRKHDERLERFDVRLPISKRDNQICTRKPN
jgi:hypothetical protein